jgi:carboxyl-terminal processing protease
VFGMVDENALQVEENREQTTKTLNLEKFMKRQKKLQKQSKELREALNKETNVKVNQLQENYETFSEDSVKMERFKKWKNDLKEDIYLEEAIHILDDIH